MKKIIMLLCFMVLVPKGLLAQNENAQDWPKDIVSGEYTISLYQPENTAYVDNKLTSSLAFGVKKEGQEPVFGMLWTTSLLDVDRTSRRASLVSVNVDEIRLPNEINEGQKAKFQKLINSEVPKWDIEFSLEDLLESLEEVSVTTSELNNAAPKILFAKEPTALILIDGEPKLKEVEKGYELVENTGAFILKEAKTNNYYLKGGDFWYQSKAVLGPYSTVKKVPSKIEGISKKAEPEEKDDSESADEYSGPAPKILIVKEPSELIVFEGEPTYSPIQNTNLLFVENTESNIFMNITSQTYYVLLSGRWFTTKDIKGAWNYLASEKLPEDFKKISSDSKKANVLSNVPGTKEAKDAVYDAQIPQTAAVKKDTKATTVVYNGNPEFNNIEDLKLQYAVNTESSVFKDKNTYYLCDNAIWFKSSTPNGPWAVSEDRPEDIEKIPANNPQYNTKYVYIYETSPTVVYVGYTPGYYGSYVYGPTVVYGTGFYYNPWYRGFYYHHHYSYGFSVRYNPYYGWSFGFRFGSPYFWYGHSYWGHGHHYWGPPYYRPPYYRPGYYARPSRPIYTGRRGVSNYSRPVTRPNRPVNRPSTRPTANRPTTRPSTMPATRPATRPSTTPATRPTTNRPTTRPSPGFDRPSTMPSNRPNYTPNTRPSTRPSTPSYRPAPRPASRPAARPSSGVRRR
ncbi:hypothetical protein V8G56_03885 [Gaetbulibacter aquiaggeris]|uniref:Carbohydrate-binding family V/XII n=1 Tax=Gaetbulibacter aquiaggeris TaxID=1735373 RepID=A0ABW7MQ65_9FLAO